MGSNPKQVIDLIGSVYRAARDPSAWPTFLEELRRTAGLGGIMFSFRSSTLAPVIDAYPAGKAVEAMGPYNEHFHKVDPFGKVFMDMPPGRLVGPGAAILDHRDVMRTAYYNDLLAPMGLEDSLCAMEHSRRYGFTSLAGLTESGQRWDEHQLELFRLLAPHVFQAVSLARTFEHLEFERDVARQTLSRADFGCVVLDADGNVEWMNRLAVAIVDTDAALRVDDGRLTAIDERSNDRLRRATRAALGLRHGEPHPVQAIFTVRRKDGRQPLEMLVSPLEMTMVKPDCTPTPRSGSFGGAMVIIADPTFVHEGLAGRLEQLHDLTPTEAEVAQWLLSGSSVNEVAEIFGNSVHTIRTHVKRLLAKTNTSSQAQLVGYLQRSLARLL